MSIPTVPTTISADTLTEIKVAREIAADIRDLPAILKLYGVSDDGWQEMQKSERFQRYLISAVAEWNAVSNTSERVKVKALAFVEEALPEFYARVHDQREPLNAKVEVLKSVARLAGIGGTVEGAVTGERMIVTINLGADHKLTFSKDVSQPMKDVTPESNTIEGTGKAA